MIQRHIEKRVREALSDTPVVVINGARQTGKTTLVQSIAKDTGAQYLTFDDAGTLSLAHNDPYGFIANLPDKVVIDEVQKAPEVFPAIKIEVDRKRQPGRFLLTGSASVLALPKLSESLAGRMEVISLFPFSRGEISKRGESFLIKALKGEKFHPIKRELGLGKIYEIMAQGGFPEAVMRKEPRRRSAWFNSYISTVLQRDVKDLTNINGIHSLPNLLNILASRSAGLMNFANIARDAALPHMTAKRYFSLLEMLFLVYRLPAWSANIGKRFVKAPKIHVADTGLACHLLGVDEQRLKKDSQITGRILESFVVNELRKQASWADMDVSLFHYRSAGGEEIDIVAESRQGDAIGIEVKTTATVNANDFRVLKIFSEELGDKFCMGVVIYLGEQVLPFGNHFYAVPLQLLWD